MEDARELLQFRWGVFIPSYAQWREISQIRSVEPQQHASTGLQPLKKLTVGASTNVTCLVDPHFGLDQLTNGHLVLSLESD